MDWDSWTRVFCRKEQTCKVKVKFWLHHLALEIQQSKKDRWAVRVGVLDSSHQVPLLPSACPSHSGQRVDTQEVSATFLICFTKS